MDISSIWAVLYSHYSHEHDMYPYHFEELSRTLESGQTFFLRPHDNAWVLVGVFATYEEAVAAVDRMETIRPPKVRIEV